MAGRSRSPNGVLIFAVVVLALLALAVAVFIDAPAAVWILVGIAAVASIVSFGYGVRTRG